MPMGIAIRKSCHVGATPRFTLSTSVCGESTSTVPITTSSTWVMKSVSASTTFRPAASLTPTTLIAHSTAITPMPKTMSPGEVRR